MRCSPSAVTPRTLVNCLCCNSNATLRASFRLPRLARQVPIRTHAYSTQSPNPQARSRPNYEIAIFCGLTAVIATWAVTRRKPERLDAPPNNQRGALTSGAPVEINGQDHGPDTDQIATGTSTVPYFPRNIWLPRSESASEEGKSAALPAGIGASQEQEEYRLLGLGIRKVSFLRIQVYVVGLYVAKGDMGRLQEELIRASVGSGASTLVQGEKEDLRETLLDGEGSTKVWSEVLKELGVRSAVRIVPTRNTNFLHMRDGWIRGIDLRGKGKEFEDEAFKIAVDQFKGMLGGRGSVGKGKVLLLGRGANGALRVWVESDKEGADSETSTRQGEPMKLLGTVKDERISRLVWMGYLAGQNIASEDARRSIVDGVIEMVERPLGTIETQVVEAVESALTQSLGERNGTRDFYAANGQGARTAPRLPSVARSFAADEGEDSRPQPRSEDTTARLHAQEERIRQLEYRIIGLERATHGAKSPELTKAEPQLYSDPGAAVDEETMIFRGKHFKTQFYGASHNMSYLSHLPELRLFMKDMIVQHPGSAALQRELQNTKIKGPGQEDSLPTSDKALISLLPPKKTVDQQVQIYVDNLESTYRVLHLPSFWEEYSIFWDAPQEGRPAFAAILLLILASIYCVKERDSSLFRGDSSVGRETAIMWIRNCDSWLQSQSQKHTNMAVFQIHCLSFIAKKMNSIKRKRTWRSAGDLMRLALSSGLHRDAHIVNIRHAKPNLKRVSAFDQEMRRRMWATISELELQAAFDRGMPAMLRDLVEDCGPPLNLDDNEFGPSTEQLPETRPVSQYTRSSFQHLSRSSWSLRLELLSVINGPHPQMAYEDVLLYDKKILQHLDGIPHWGDQASLVSGVLLQLQLQVFLLFLHRPYAREEARSSRYNYSAIMHLRSAMNILDLHHQLTSTGNIFLCLFRNDAFGAALSICYNYTASEPSPDQNLPARNSIRRLSSDPLPYLENALNMIEDKIMSTGIGIQEHYCVCAIIGLLKKKLSQGDSRYEEQKAAYRVTQIIQKVLSLQDNYSAAATLASLPNMPISAPTSLLSNGNGNSNGMGSSGHGTDMLQDFGQDLEGLDLTNIAGWDLETFWNF